MSATTPSDAMRWTAEPESAETPPREASPTPPLWESGMVVLEWGLMVRAPAGRAITTGYAWMVNVAARDDDERSTYVNLSVAQVVVAQEWAAGVVYDNTDLQVTGWQEVHAVMAGGSGPKYVADLVRRVHRITVEADSLGFLGTYWVKPRRARKLRRQMRWGGVLTLDEVLPDTNAAAVRCRSYLPAGQVRMIEVVEHHPVSAAALVEEYRTR
jgi:hypothetical protein